ncbi:hypothetical protein J6Y73_01765 [bacterium]|nr:hypothetical protein [bacterium]
MKTQVTITKDVLLKYYKEFIIKKLLWVIILIFLIGTSGFIYFLIDKDYVFSISILIFTFLFIFLMINIYKKVKNQTEKEYIYDIEYEIEFKEKLNIYFIENSYEYEYKRIKYQRLKSFYIFKIYDLTKTFYLVPRDSFNKDEWKQILTNFKKKRRD